MVSIDISSKKYWCESSVIKKIKKKKKKSQRMRALGSAIGTGERGFRGLGGDGN